MTDHDGNYKRLFSHQRTVADLLRGYVAQEWIGELDLTSLETVPTEHISDQRLRRQNDVIWRVRWHDKKHDSVDWLYCYFMMEFQSGVDPLMAVRIMIYVGLLYEHLVQSGQAKANDLPPLLPIVLYNGDARWTAATNVADLIPRLPKAFAPFVPQVSYLFLDEGRLATSAQVAEQNLAAAIFQIEQSDVDQVIPFASAVMSWLAGAEQEPIRRDLAIWIERVVLEPERLSQMDQSGRIMGVEEPAMLAEKARVWRESLIAEGKAEGKAEMICELVVGGTMTVDQARIQIHNLISSGQIAQDKGQEALDQLS